MTKDDQDKAGDLDVTNGFSDYYNIIKCWGHIKYPEEQANFKMLYFINTPRLALDPSAVHSTCTNFNGTHKMFYLFWKENPIVFI